MFQEAVDPTVGAIIQALLEQYGITGLAFGGLLYMMLKTNKSCQTRIEKLEEQQEKLHAQHLEDHKSMIMDYTELVKNETSVLSNLTGCLTAIKATLDSMERRQQ